MDSNNMNTNETINENRNVNINENINENMNANTPVPTMVYQPVLTKQDSEKLKMIFENFGFFGIGSLIYGVLMTICLYYGFSGISFPVFTFVTIFWVVLVIKNLEILNFKNAIFYFIAMGLLGISSFLTMDVFLIFCNVVGIILLLLALLLSQYGDTKKWGFTKYVGEMLAVCIMPFGYLYHPFKSFAHFISKKDEEKNTKTKYIWIGVIIAIPFLLIVISLLTSADAVFSNMFATMFKNVSWPKYPIRIIIFMFLGCLFSYSIFAYLADENVKYETKEGKKLEPVVAITFLSMVTLVYLVFSVIQILYLFIGNFELPKGYTYATYAREGFFQLLAVCVINLFVILFCVAFFGDNKLLKAVMTVFSICTYIMIASSALRMTLYVKAYDLSYLRIMVYWGLILIGLVFAGCMIQIWKKEFPLFRYSILVVSILYIGLSFMRPQSVIAKYNLSKDKSKVDMDYLMDLGADAVPVLKEYGCLDEGIEIYKDYKVEKAKKDAEGKFYSVYKYSELEKLDYKKEKNLSFVDEITDTYKERNALNFNYSLYRAYAAIQ